MRIETEGFHNYAVMPDCENSYFIDIEYPMLKNHTPEAFLPIQIREENGEINIYYEITGRISYQEWGESHKMNFQDIQNLLESMLLLYENLEEYMLDFQQIIFRKEEIYIRPGNQVQWMYGPELQKNLAGDMEAFFLWMLSNIDYEDLKGVSLIYQIYSVAKEKGICKEYLMECLQKPTKEAEEDIRFLMDEPEEMPEMPEKIPKKRRHITQIGILLKCFLILIDLGLLGVWGYGIYRYGIQHKSMLAVGTMFLALFLLLLSIFLDIRDQKKNMEKMDRAKEKKGQELPKVNKRELAKKQSIFEQLDNHWERGEETVLLSDAVPEEIPALYNPKTSQIVKIQVLPFYIGSEGALNQLPLSNPTVSRQHAVITEGEWGQYYIEDLDSKNGTRVNGRSLSPENPVRIADGAQIMISDEIWLFQQFL